MKQLLLFVLFISFLASCNKQEETIQWEYKVMTLDENLSLQEYTEKIGKKYAGIQGREATRTIQFGSPESQLNELGKEGWELVTTYTTIETEFPNFGDLTYHTGIKTNTRTEKIIFILKRKFIKSKVEENISEEIPEISVEEYVFEDTLAPDSIVY